MSVRRILALVVLVFFILPSVYFIFSNRDNDALEIRLKDLGFYPIRPPSTLVGPGSLYHVTRDGRFYTTVCKVDGNLISEIVQRSPSERTIERQLQETQYALTASLTKVIQSAVGKDAIASVTYALSDVSVLEINLASNKDIFDQLISDKSCKIVVDALLEDKQFVCQGQAALVASLELNLNTKSGSRYDATSVQEIDSLKKTLEASLKEEIKVDAGRILSGVNLHYGIKVNPLCIAPMGAKYPRKLPNGIWDRFMNFVQIDVLGG